MISCDRASANGLCKKIASRPRNERLQPDPTKSGINGKQTNETWLFPSLSLSNKTDTTNKSAKSKTYKTADENTKTDSDKTNKNDKID